MNRIDRIFKDLRAAGRGGLMPFLTAGDPDLETTAKLLPAFERAGACVCEIGIPFSDPIADGPVIQASMTRALGRGVKVREVFDRIKAQRSSVELGLVAMVSYSIVHRVGLERFIGEAKDAGFDGLIFPDLAVEESDDAVRAAGDAGLILSMLIAPTTPDDRAQRIARASTGFVYVLARAGITGERSELPADLPGRITALRAVTDLPIAVGFGVSNAGQVRDVVSVADAAIVGSAVVRRIHESASGQAGGDAVVADAAGFVAELAGGLDRA